MILIHYTFMLCNSITIYSLIVTGRFSYKDLLFPHNKELNRNAVFARLTYPKKRLNRKKLVRRHILICDLVSSIYTRFVRVVVVHVCRIWKRKYHKRKIKERRFKSRLKAEENYSNIYYIVLLRNQR